ncbi:MAG: sugar ABC transporter ATP-binding protein [Planctomycetaceae bacterium]|jgi:ribose transport system ATP-binding protein|nr:sugar ABC transporter ATP-binding protein [Planctomycetaceae bacterium]MDG2391492.1 sugar ABC transporter ATP-binding protein [Planctomycetaceae bacterium]
MNYPLLEVRIVTKYFPGVVALKQVSLTLEEGEVLALIGENGAGKSTLMKILAGIQQPDLGKIFWNGKEANIDSVEAAMKLGIALIHQELNLADNLDIGSNIFLGREPRNKLGIIDRRKIREESLKVLERVGLDFDPRTSLTRLSIGQQQLVEIAKALSMNAKILIMDEPTSSLSSKETARLFEVVKDLKQQGVSVIYISHRLGEVKELADRVVVFRDGQNSGELGKEEITHERMVQLMVGRDVSQLYERTPHQPGDEVLKVTDLVTPAFPGKKNSFTIRAGEIVGMAGLVGAGRTELLRVLFGIDDPIRGSLEVGGKLCEFHHPKDAINAGMVLVPEDRKGQGLVIDWPLDMNGSLPGLDQHLKQKAFIDKQHEVQTAETMIGDLNIKTPNRKQILQFLSGGNQQKVVLGKWLALNPKILLLDEPTRGIDVGAKEEIYHLMDKLAAEGLAVLFVSSELEEIMGVSDRALVMHEGKITGELTRSELSEESIMQLATGQELAGAQ